MHLSIHPIKSGYFIFHNASTNIFPDYQYHQNDGGPYAVVQQVLRTCNVINAGVYDRNTVLFKP